MKLEDLQKIFENATEEHLQKINSCFDNSKDKELINQLQEENNTLRTDLTDFKEKVKDLEKNKGNTEEMQTKITELEKELQIKDEQYAKEKEDRRINEVISDVFADKKFVNDVTKQGYFDKLKTAILDENNKGKSAKELFENMTKDVDNIFINEQQEKIEIPPVGNIGSNKKFTEKQIEAMTVEEINANWDIIKEGVNN
ncbi:MAG: phage scaffolding protein [Eubacteriales bacterium]|nr:phage scaffolding protein [Eubacteriales bacterium]